MASVRTGVKIKSKIRIIFAARRQSDATNEYPEHGELSCVTTIVRDGGDYWVTAEGIALGKKTSGPGPRSLDDGRTGELHTLIQRSTEVVVELLE